MTFHWIYIKSQKSLCNEGKERQCLKELKIKTVGYKREKYKVGLFDQI